LKGCSAGLAGEFGDAQGGLVWVDPSVGVGGPQRDGAVGCGAPLQLRRPDPPQTPPPLPPPYPCRWRRRHWSRTRTWAAWSSRCVQKDARGPESLGVVAGSLGWDGKRLPTLLHTRRSRRSEAGETRPNLAPPPPSISVLPIPPCRYNYIMYIKHLHTVSVCPVLLWACADPGDQGGCGAAADAPRAVRGHRHQAAQGGWGVCGVGGQDGGGK
jgi:hypothetical protein